MANLEAIPGDTIEVSSPLMFAISIHIFCRDVSSHPKWLARNIMSFKLIPTQFPEWGKREGGTRSPLAFFTHFPGWTPASSCEYEGVHWLHPAQRLGLVTVTEQLTTSLSRWHSEGVWKCAGLWTGHPVTVPLMVCIRFAKGPCTRSSNSLNTRVSFISFPPPISVV